MSTRDAHRRRPNFADLAREGVLGRLRRPGFPEISTRHWREMAFGLSLAAAILATAFSIWPIAFFNAYRPIAVIWGVVGYSAGTLYLGAAYFAQRRHPIASPILSISGLLLMVSGLGSGRLLALTALEYGWLAIAFDLLPILLGILAACAVGASVDSPTQRGGLAVEKSKMRAELG